MATQGIVPVFGTDGASGGGGGGGSGEGDFALVSDDAGNTTTGTNGVLKTVGFAVTSAPDVTASSFAATLLDKPPASALNSGSLTVVDTDMANPDVTFTPDTTGRFMVRLVGTDANANDAQDVTVVQVSPDPPQLVGPAATAGGVDGAAVNVTFTNTGGAVASTTGTLVKPAASSATLTHTSPNLTASYTPDVPGVYGVEMDGTNGDGTSPKVVARRSVESRAPTAEAGANQSDVAPGTVNLSSAGSAVNGASGGTLTYLWAFVSDDTATLSSTTAASPTFTGVIDESYIVQLTVTDTETGESATDIVSVVMQATPMPAASAVCDFTTDTLDDTTWTPGATTTLFEDDGVTAKASVYYNAAGHSDGSDVIEISEANGAYIRTRWSGSGASVNRRFVIEPAFPGATLDWSGRIIVAVLLTQLSADGSGGSNAAIFRLGVGPASTTSDYNSAGQIGIDLTENGTTSVWQAMVYNGSTTPSLSAAATGNYTTDPAGGSVLVVFALDEVANIRVALGESDIPANINDVVYDFESSATAGNAPTAAASNPWAASPGGLAVTLFVNNKSTATPGETIFKCSKIKVWTD